MPIEEYLLPHSLDEAVRLRADHGPSLYVMAGGTIAMQGINEGEIVPERVMGLRRAGMAHVRRDNGSLAIGATTTLREMEALSELPLLGQAARNTGSWSIRNMGTVGGNLFAPPPSGDFAVALLALDTEVTLVSPNGERTLPLRNFYTGWTENVLQDDELVAELRVPVKGGVSAYTKYGRKQAHTPSVVSVAAWLALDGDRIEDARIALNAVGPHPIRATNAEGMLVGAVLDEEAIADAAAAAAEEAEPFTDAIASDWYRRKMVDVYVRRTLARIREE